MRVRDSQRRYVGSEDNTRVEWVAYLLLGKAARSFQRSYCQFGEGFTAKQK